MTLIYQPFTRRPMPAFPRSGKPVVLAVLHSTSNTATPDQEWKNVNDHPTWDVSATIYRGRDGNGIRALNPSSWAAWGQAPLDHADLTEAGVRALTLLGNPNYGVWETIECVDNGQGWTDAQFEAVAQDLVIASKATSLPIDRDHVLTHRDINTVNRPLCPFNAIIREANMARVIARANVLMTQGEVPMRVFTVTGVSTTIEVLADAPHRGVPLDGSSTWPLLTAGQHFTQAVPIHLAAPIPYGLPTENRSDGYLVVFSSLDCIILAKDVKVIPTVDLTPFAQADLDKAYNAGRSAVVAAASAVPARP